MTSPPDKLFRDGLGEYKKPASSSAWDRIETNLDRKQPKMPWMIIRIAAGIILLMALTILLWPDQEASVGIASAEVENTDPVSNADPQNTTSPESTTTSVAPSTPSPTEKSSHSVPTTKTKSQKIISQSPLAEVALTKEVISAETETEIILTHSEPVVATAETGYEVLDNNSVETKRVSISYSADQVNSRFIKKDLVAQATSEKKNTSSLLKVIDTALDLKNDESLIGELREKKNELLSFNYLSKTQDDKK